MIITEALVCRNCGAYYTQDDYVDSNDEGYWCDSCDSYNYFEADKHDQHKFILILEDKFNNNEPIQKTNNKFKKNLSPLRYPGGKSKLIPYLHSHLQKNKCEVLASPFSGGGSFELSMLEAGVVKRIHLNDLDYGIYSLWWTILHAPFTLIDRINSNQLTHKCYFEAQTLIKNNFVGANNIEAAWATLLVNRLAYSGIAKANPLGGKHGTQEQLLSRWTPNTLIKRIEHIYSLSDRIEISCMDAVEFIETEFWNNSATLYIDPPYLEKGKALYNFFYTKRDHINLCIALDGLHSGTPCADILVTYDYSNWLEQLYQHPKIKIIGRKYSI